tara:strand:+ start:497 stop:772 length:276 start_codon:yes stop_codon:yes gene_type:complete
MSEYKIDFTLNELITMKMVVDEALVQVDKQIKNTSKEISNPSSKEEWYHKSLLSNLDYLIGKRKDLNAVLEKYNKSNEYLVYSPEDQSGVR